MSIRLICTFLASLAIAPVHAKGFESFDDAVAMTEKVMEKVADGAMQEGLALAKPYTIVPAAEFDAMIGQVEMQMPILRARFGKSVGYERIRNDTVGSSLSRVIYLQRFEKHALVWRFILYRGSEGWILNTVDFVDDINAAFLVDIGS